MSAPAKTEITPQKSASISVLPADRVTYVEIGEDAAGQRLDNYLVRVAKGVPKSHIYRVVRQGEVRVNRKRAKAELKLETGDVLRIPPMRVSQRPVTQAPAAPFAEGAIPVLYEDRHLLVVNKPAGIAAHGGSGISYGLIERLRATHPDEPMLELCHRLDKETSGAIVIAKTRKALVRMHDLMKAGGVEKHYFTLVKGDWVNERQHVRLPLERYLLASGERRVRVSAEGMKAHSIFTQLERFGAVTFLDVELKTGRTHQIRVHACASGHPLVGDDKYGDFEFNKAVAQGTLGMPFKRMFLHAARLAFEHPVSGEALDIRAPLPPECEGLLAALRRSR
ncbi:RluA family pseudouridine synthase [Sutterella massiliensis]|uniref:Pseudouridine synthase n=1 Tax=Sutterella massiliensis TaxID=1816689 RepID=A0ABS2DR26_9BURK|nr:RluA family pseudouridine synthase [Sutterella massiliensis]MBM6703786.1 RluA family pseudouridine synthase [Sutterella massiliensis]